MKTLVFTGLSSLISIDSALRDVSFQRYKYNSPEASYAERIPISASSVQTCTFTCIKSKSCHGIELYKLQDRSCDLLVCPNQESLVKDTNGSSQSQTELYVQKDLHLSNELAPSQEVVEVPLTYLSYKFGVACSTIHYKQTT